MAFDLTDEGGRSLSLMSRAANGRISGAFLAAYAKRLVPGAQLDGLEADLRAVGEGELPASEQHARWLLARIDETSSLKPLADDARFRWWLKTLAHSSLVCVEFDGSKIQDHRFKLSYEEKISSEQGFFRRRLTRLGWAS